MIGATAPPEIMQLIESKKGPGSTLGFRYVFFLKVPAGWENGQHFKISRYLKNYFRNNNIDTSNQ